MYILPLPSSCTLYLTPDTFYLYLCLRPRTLYLLTLYLSPYLLPFTSYLLPYTLHLIPFTFHLLPPTLYLLPLTLYLVSHALYHVKFTFTFYLYLVPYT
jgi:hypothetical protein